MDINTTNIPNIGVRESEVVHRVERDNAARDFGEKNQQDRQERKKERSSTEPVDDEVDVSEAYLSSIRDENSEITEDTCQNDLDGAEKRLDIEA